MKRPQISYKSPKHGKEVFFTIELLDDLRAIPGNDVDEGIREILEKIDDEIDAQLKE